MSCRICVCLFVCLFACLLACLLVCLFVCLFVLNPSNHQKAWVPWNQAFDFRLWCYVAVAIQVYLALEWMNIWDIPTYLAICKVCSYPWLGSTPGVQMRAFTTTMQPFWSLWWVAQLQGFFIVVDGRHGSCSQDSRGTWEALAPNFWQSDCLKSWENSSPAHCLWLLGWWFHLLAGSVYSMVSISIHFHLSS